MTAYRLSRSILLCFPVLLCTLLGCQKTNSANEKQGFQIVATTSMLADLVTQLAGDKANVQGLMGPGVDPHLYKATEGDVIRMTQADLIVYNGLHLEGKMTEVFEQMEKRGISTFAAAQAAVPEESRLASQTYTGNYDPHVWFDVSLWQQVAEQVHTLLKTMDPDNSTYYDERAADYLAQLVTLDQEVREKAESIPVGQRVLITSHDAFGYFGNAYGFEVRALQGLSTATEAGTADVQELARFVAERRIPAMFIESSVSPKGIEAVQAAVQATGFVVAIGGYLYSDALGDPDTPEGTYTGTVRHNMDTILKALHPHSATSE